MSSSVTVRPVRGVRGIGLFAIIVGIIMILAGGATYVMVTSQLRDENITVSDDAQFFGGARVQDPLTAYAQAEVINKHALEMADGQTYAELPQDDPRRATVMNASFLRASLFTSVVAFGVALLVVASGLLFLLIGIALRRLGKGEVSVLDVVPAGAAGASAAPAGPPEGAPVAPRPAPTQPAQPVERTSSRHVAPPEATAPGGVPEARGVRDDTLREAPPAAETRAQEAQAARPGRPDATPAAPAAAEPAAEPDGTAPSTGEPPRTGTTPPDDGTTPGAPRA
jgi:hypothetical protein